MFWAILGWTLIGCAGMAVMDLVGTVLTKAIQAGKPNLAGLADMIGDAAKLTVLAAAGPELIFHYRPWGWLGIIPILATAFLVTRHAVILTHGIENADDAAEDDERDGKIKWLEAQLLAGKAERERDS